MIAENWPYFVVFLVFFLFTSFGLYILFAKHSLQKVRYILAGLFFALGLSAIDVSLLVTGAYSSYLQLAFWLGFLAFSYGPLIYLFTRSQLYFDRLIVSRDLLHALPSLIYLLLVGLFYWPLSLSDKKNVFQAAASGESMLLGLVSMLSVVSIIVYLILSYLLYRRFISQLRDQYSSVEDKKIKWVKHVLFGFIILISINILLQTIDSLIADFNLFEPFSLISLFVLLGFIMITVYRGLQGDISFQGISQNKSLSLQASQKSDINKVDSIELAKLEEYMMKSEPYLDPDVTLKSLADDLAFSERHLSTLLNAGLKKSFFDYINGFRITHVKMLLTQQEKYTILQCMYSAGFNSKSSFNTAFKKETGMTPSAYRKLALKK